MMTKKNLLEHGLLEQYVLGELDSSQVAQAESLIDNDHELQTRLRDIESVFEKLAFENAINPPAEVKTNLMVALKENKATIPLQRSSNKKWYLGIAASIAAFCLLGSFWLYNELKSVKEQLQIVNDTNQTLEKELNGLGKQYEKTKKWAQAINDPNTEQYILKGNSLSPNAKIVSYVNHSLKSVIINTKQLPELDKDHDYQMWADVDGEMIDMGVISKNKDLLAMKYIDNAESLNITIEPSGGNDHPTVERLISNVYLN